MTPIAKVVPFMVLLAACDNAQPFEFATSVDPVEDPVEDPVIEDPEDPGEPLELSGFVNNGTQTPIPENVAGNLIDAEFSPGSNTITVTGAALDTTPIPGTFTRNTSLDIPGYLAYSVQEDALDRMFIGLLAESADGSVEGGVIQDGGQFGRFFGGSFYRRNGNYTAYVPSQPNRGLVSYTGPYAGLTNLNAPRSGSVDVLPLPPGVGFNDPVSPQEPDRVVGTVFINADFSDMQINGTIYDRELVGRGTELEPIFLIATEIGADGTFVGGIELTGDQTSIGTYSGAFGGTQASAVAAGIHIENYLEGVENEEEFGAFVLMRCGLPGGGALCDSVDPE